MRHYEITLIVHPDQSSQVLTMIEKYKELITSSGGIVHRNEDWGRKWASFYPQATFDGVDAGHFLQETHGPEIVSLLLGRIRDE